MPCAKSRRKAMPGLMRAIPANCSKSGSRSRPEWGPSRSGRWKAENRGSKTDFFFLHPIAESNKSIIFAINMTSHASRRTAHPGRSSSFYIVASY